MQNKDLIINDINIKDKIYNIRNIQVMLDKDLASLYKVENKRLNEQVKRNIQRFPIEFMFQLTQAEYDNLKSQFATSSLVEHGGRRKLPFVFTEQGVSMLSAVLKSKTAISVSINIIKSFVSMKKVLSQNQFILNRFDNIEKKLFKYDDKFDTIFKALENKNKIPTQGIFYNGQIYDAYAFVNDILKSAKFSITLVDNYIDDTVLTLFSKYSKLKYKIITVNISKQLKLDINKYNSQYNNLEVIINKTYHDRFITIDDKELYHLGASLKDLGKKVFAFNKMDIKIL